MKMKMTHKLNTENFIDELKKSAMAEKPVLFRDFLNDFLMKKENASLISASVED